MPKVNVFAAMALIIAGMFAGAVWGRYDTKSDFARKLDIVAAEAENSGASSTFQKCLADGWRETHDGKKYVWKLVPNK